ncbi:polysaccharide biosynthesis/export family protein [Prochlorothrix hollandica]|uniref:polysaccharide biosynthesis/export family protein n=1 Tax=Prochlorothrix hollandica TaxID=1223 RepID=UPI000346EFA9|nr:polysaccharide biosynthesis/export family protein [Prochlorothrix hollandica]
MAHIVPIAPPTPRDRPQPFLKAPSLGFRTVWEPLVSQKWARLRRAGLGLVLWGLSLSPGLAQTPSPELGDRLQQQLRDLEQSQGREPTPPPEPFGFPPVSVPGLDPAGEFRNPGLTDPGLGVEESIEAKFRRYRLGPGDFVLINVQRFPDLTFQGTVNPEGAIVFPLLGTVPIQGFSLQEAQAQIQQALDQYIINPQVTLSLLAQRPVQVTVVGAIARPGFYNLASTRIPDALITAGGSLADADLRAIQVYRTLPDQSIIEQSIDLYTPLVEGQPLPNLRLEDGDVIKVLTQGQAVELGFVPPAGSEADATLGDGGGEPGVGGVSRGYNDRLVSTSPLAANLPLKIRILSYAAGAGGTLELPAGSTFRDALNGIPLDSANLRRIALIRYDAASGQAVQTTINGRNALVGDPTADLPLATNDVIIVGRSLISKVSFALNQFTQPFRDVLGFLLFFDSLGSSAQNLFQPSGSD